MLRRAALVRTIAKGAAGFLAGAAIWLFLGEPYHAAVAAPAQILLRAFESPPATRLKASGREVLVERDDFPPASPRPGIPASDLDFNIAILGALFASSSRPLSDRGVVRLLAGCALLYATHVAALVAGVESIYAFDLGAWSRAHYGVFARNFWGAAAHFYRIAGIFAVPFALWWAFAAELPRRPEKRGR